MFKKDEFIQFILDQDVVGVFDKTITLKSGRPSNWYVNWRSVAQDVYAMDQLCDYVLSFCASQDLDVDTFYGVPEGATKLGVLCQYKYALQSDDFKQGSHALAMGRGKAKAHGSPQDQFFLGLPKGKTLLLEDVTTTGMSLILAAKKLQEADVDIMGALALTNRMDDPHIDVKQELADLGIPYMCMTTGQDIIPALLAQANSKGVKLSQASLEEFERLIQ